MVAKVGFGTGKRAELCFLYSQDQFGGFTTSGETGFGDEGFLGFEDVGFTIGFGDEGAAAAVREEGFFGAVADELGFDGGAFLGAAAAVDELGFDGWAFLGFDDSARFTAAFTAAIASGFEDDAFFLRVDIGWLGGLWCCFWVGCSI